MPTFIKFKFVGIVLLFCSVNLNAQPGGGDPSGGGKPVPISGIEILIAAGGALGLKRILTNRRLRS